MLELFNKYYNENKIKEALIIGRNMVNRNPDDVECFIAFEDLLVSLAENLLVTNERQQFIYQAEVTLGFFEERVELNDSVIKRIQDYHKRVNDIKKDVERSIKEEEQRKLAAIKGENNRLIKQLMKETHEINSVEKPEDLSAVLQKIEEVDRKISHDYLTPDQKNSYDGLNKKYTELLSNKMKELERIKNIDYNKKAVDAFAKAYSSFKADEGRYKNQSNLRTLVSGTLFAYDAARLFNETLVYYNHVYSYIFSKLNDDGKLALTRFSIECERLVD